MMNDPNSNDKDAQKAGGAELAKEVEKKCEAWGENIDKKADALVKKLPPPVNALLDAVCMTVIFAGITWVLVRMNRLPVMPSWKTFGILAGAIFVVSLIYRLMIKPKKQGK
ncbi:MAG: hypothetical protein GX608_11815 [Lentisphaerae bacterium]|nr:hypothetical protein [Lentisphaerota bacterium]